jgi:hypothetical protein
MSSTTLQKLASPEAGAAIEAVVEAVAERSFFTVVEHCAEAVLTAQAASVPRWLTATVRFEEGDLRGTVTCTLPETLGHSLFDSFSGREPSEAPPAERELYDLVGEFANMICGAWLSRCAGDRAFRLGSPLVARAGVPAANVRGRVWVGVGNLPAAVDVALHPQSDAVAATAGA